MKKILLFAAATAVALSSCSKNEIAETPESAMTAIGFSTYVGTATKATVESEFTTGDTFLLYSYFEEATSGSAADFTKPSDAELFISKQTVTAYSDATNGGTDELSWAYYPIKYWPNDAGDKLSFFAVTNGSSTLPVSELTGTDALTFTTDAYPTTDIMVASAFNATKTTSVSLPFKHTMTQVLFTAQLAEALVTDATSEATSATAVTLTGISVSYGAENKLSDGKYTFTFSNTTASSGEWSIATAGTTTDLEDTSVYSNTTGTTLTATATESAIGTPVLVLPFSSNSFTVTVNYTVKTTDSGLTNGASTVNNSATFTITPTAMNTTYTYNIKVDLDTVTVDGTMEAWSASTTNVTVANSTGTTAS